MHDGGATGTYFFDDIVILDAVPTMRNGGSDECSPHSHLSRQKLHRMCQCESEYLNQVLSWENKARAHEEQKVMTTTKPNCVTDAVSVNTGRKFFKDVSDSIEFHEGKLIIFFTLAPKRHEARGDDD
jgi:hypothetical protein